MVIDLYAAEILRATANPHIPQGDWPGVRIFNPHWQRLLVKRNQLFHLLDQYKENRFYPQELAEIAGESTMLVRPSMAAELEGAGCLTGGKLIYSLWHGYLKEESTLYFIYQLACHGVPIVEIHTSGHASIPDLQRLANSINAKMLVPIHSFKAIRYPEFFEKVEVKHDGEWWEV